MRPDLVDVVRSSFARRSVAMARPGQTVVDQPGVCGVIGSPDAPGGRLLITDDRALSFVRDLGPELPVQLVNVLSSAPRCRDLVERAGGWEAKEATAMVCRDLSGLRVPSMPDGLDVRPVRRVPDDPDSGVPLEHAALACQRADPSAAEAPLAGFVGFLASLPTATRLLAAVDGEGEVRATSGATALGADANAYFVSTDPLWRGRGVATAMTAAALSWARGEGAQQACLDASAAGLPIYLRLGFEPISPTCLFARFG